MIYVVLGMHKSGTTLISKTLHKSGIDMGEFDEAVTYNEGNQYERNATLAINRTILRCGDTHSLDVLTPADSLAPDDAINDTIACLINGLNDSESDWGFKDPRTCLTYPIWERSLTQPYKLIFVYRSPVEVWHHYRKSVPTYRVLKRLRRGHKAIKAWLVYNAQLLKFMKRSRLKYILVNFEDFMADSSSLTALSTYVGRPLTDCREPGLYRSKAEPDLMYRICTALLSTIYSQKADELFFALEQQRQGAGRSSPISR